MKATPQILGYTEKPEGVVLRCFQCYGRTYKSLSHFNRHHVHRCRPVLVEGPKGIEVVKTDGRWAFAFVGKKGGC